MKSTNKYDRNGDELFEGDKVMKAWNWFSYQGEAKVGYQIHTITVRDAHLMANNEMHDDGGGIIFCLGKTYNFWEGKEVIKLNSEDIKKININEDVSFFFDKDKNAVKLTDKYFFNMTDEQWGAHVKKLEQSKLKILFGK